jgi:reductive dehalogenase
MIKEGIPTSRVDERTIMFSRAELIPGTEQFDQYYLDHPDHLEKDMKFRSLPGLLKPGTLHYNLLVFKAADATFRTVSALHDQVDGPVGAEAGNVEPPKISTFITQWSKSLGAYSVGILNLKPHHLYSIGGRRHNYGKPIENNHKYAIVFTVEMDYRRVRMAPNAPITMESSEQYLRTGSIAVTIASFIRSLGYSARAHIDGNYQVRCPQIARDAGLGVIGRLGLLITPGLGPRVRIAVVTTDIPLVCSSVKPDPTIEDFCKHCKKCAINCPANAISLTKKQSIHVDWAINQEACYNYWCKSGTDCGRCLSVCPYSHQANFFHNTIRSLVRQSKFLRRLAIPMDNLLFGKRPGIIKMDGWMQK